MIRVTADSNIFISAFNWGGKPERLIEMARVGQIELAVSEPIVTEIARILEEHQADKPLRQREEPSDFLAHDFHGALI